MILLTADLHLDDREENEYRWDVFENILDWVVEQQHGKLAPLVIIAGDLGDKKDRHSAKFVNRLVGILKSLVAAGAQIAILRGNHDTAINGPAYWEFLSEIHNVAFIGEPRQIKDVWFLPHSETPNTTWQDLPLSDARCIIMHQTVTGAIGDNGRVLTNEHMPRLPGNIPVYSGDIHMSQQVGPVIYIGAPHPIHFGDDYDCRMLVLNDSYKIAEVINLSPMRKHMIRIDINTGMLPIIDDGDQAKVIVKVPIDEMAQWPAQEAAIREWAALNKITLASVEPEIDGDMRRPEAIAAIIDPMLILEEFIDEQNIKKDLAAVGVSILTEYLKAL